MATTLRRPAEPAPSRAQQRKQRLLELENEQRIEDAEALKFTDEQRLSLFLSFRSVKFEWCDLDGMRSVRRRYNSPPPVRSPTHSLLQPQVRVTPPEADPVHPPALPLPLSHSNSYPGSNSNPPALAVLTNAHLASFGKDDTICVRRGHSAPQTPAPAPYERYCSTPTPYDSAPSYVESVPFPSTPQRYASMSIPACPTGLAPTPTPGMMARSVSSPPAVSLGAAGMRSSSSPSPPSARRSPPTKSPRTSGIGKRRSPIKGLFSFSGSASPSRASGSAVVTPMRVPLPPLSLVEGDDDEDEDAWVDEEDDGDTTIIADADGDVEDDDDGLQTPVPSSVWKFESAPASVPVLRVDVSGLAPPPAYEEEESEPATPTPFDRERMPFSRGEEQQQEQVGGKRKR